MTAPNARSVGGKRFYWDGVLYASEDEAATAQATYERDGFETHTSQSEGTFLVFTRRVVKQVIDVQAN